MRIPYADLCRFTVTYIRVCTPRGPFIRQSFYAQRDIFSMLHSNVGVAVMRNSHVASIPREILRVCGTMATYPCKLIILRPFRTVSSSQKSGLSSPWPASSSSRISLFLKLLFRSCQQLPSWTLGMVLRDQVTLRSCQVPPPPSVRSGNWPCPVRGWHKSAVGSA